MNAPVSTATLHPIGGPRFSIIPAGAVTALYYAVPPLRRALYLSWMYMAFPIGWVVSHAILAVVYYVLFTLTALIMRLVGRDPMQRRLEPDRASYWAEHRPDPDRTRYFRQF